MSDPFDFLHPIYSDYDPGDVGPLSRYLEPGIRITGPPTASGVYPNVLDLVAPGVTTWDILHPGIPRVTLADLHPEFYSPPVRPLDLVNLTGPRRSESPELQHIVSRPLTPVALENALQLDLTERPLSPLSLLATVTSLAHPRSLPSTPARITSPDRLLVESPLSQKSPSAQTFGERSPSYHVHSPTPSPTPAPAEAPLGPRLPSPANSPAPLSPLPAEEEARLDNQENRPPTPLDPLLVNPYAAPPCALNVLPYHPHQFYIVQHERSTIWRPVADAHLASLLNFQTHAELVDSPPTFPSVIPFKAFVHQHVLISPTDAFQANALGVPPLVICSHAGYSEPSRDTPLGYICYTYRPSLRQTFLRHPAYVRLCFAGALVITEIHDFLDGRRVYTYGRLHFNGADIFILDQGYHCEDTLRVQPFLFRYTLSPRLPLDPFAFVRVFPEEEPL